MNNKTLNKIKGFQGDLSSAYAFFVSIYDDLEFSIPFAIRGTASPKDSFTSTLRNYRKFGMISPIGKQGRKLSLTGRNLLQFLLVQRLLWNGHTLKNMQEIANLADDELKRLVMSNSVDITDIPVSELPIASTSVSNLDKNKPWYHFKMSNGIMLQIQSEKFPPEKIIEIRSAVKSAIDDIV